MVTIYNKIYNIYLSKNKLYKKLLTRLDKEGII